MKYLKSYKIFEASSHWKDDLIPTLEWSRIDELYDFLTEFLDLGWNVPAKEKEDKYWIGKKIISSSFDVPSKKIDLLKEEYYQGYSFAISSQTGSHINKDFFKEIVEFLTKLEGYEYKYKITNFNQNMISFIVYHPEDVIDPSFAIGDLKKAKVSVMIGIDNAEARLNNHRKIMNIDKKDGNLYITQSNDKYNLDRIYDIISKTLNNKFNVIQDKSNNRVIVSTKGRYT
jgi:hypothetical protein